MGEPPAQYTVHEAKMEFSAIIERVEHGEEVIISRADRPVAKIVPLPTIPRD